MRENWETNISHTVITKSDQKPVIGILFRVFSSSKLNCYRIVMCRLQVQKNNHFVFQIFGLHTKELHGVGDCLFAQVMLLTVCTNDKSNDGRANDGKMPKKKQRQNERKKHKK